jgi:hypothetical protein
MQKKIIKVYIIVEENKLYKNKRKKLNICLK